MDSPRTTFAMLCWITRAFTLSLKTEDMLPYNRLQRFFKSSGRKHKLITMSVATDSRRRDNEVSYELLKLRKAQKKTCEAKGDFCYHAQKNLSFVWFKQSLA